LHEHNEADKLPAILEELERGGRLALISDAGTPLLSDPGYRLVRACRAKGCAVSPVPGPSALLAALCASGLPPMPFVFLGFPPRRDGERLRFFAPYARLPLTLVFYERAERLPATLAALRGSGGPREICLARELTKLYEEFIYLAPGDPAPPPAGLLGEITVVAGPPATERRPAGEEVRALAARLRREKGESLKPRALARLVRERTPGWSAREIYALLDE
jgi:16S rRNA (cytidine1402-2'-O)-methyltransferase